MLEKVFHLRNESQTQQLGIHLAEILEPGLVIYLYGNLGAGKTTLTRAIIQATGYQGRVKSPTYTLVEPYKLTIKTHLIDLLHFDLYRMCTAEEFVEAGFRDEFNNQSICIIEWPEKAEGQVPLADIKIFLEIDGDGRLAKLQAMTNNGQRCLSHLKTF